MSSTRAVDGDKESNSSRENSSSGYGSAEGASDAKTELTHELVQPNEITVNIDEKRTENKENEDKHILKVTNGKASSIKQSPIPKPPRLGTLTRLDPQAYINIEIEPIDTSSKTPTSAPKPELKQDTKQSESLKPNTEDTGKKTELKTSTHESANKAATLPQLPPTDKRKAPEPPDVATSKKHASLPEKGYNKGDCNLNFLWRKFSLLAVMISANEFSFRK